MANKASSPLPSRISPMPATRPFGGSRLMAAKGFRIRSQIGETRDNPVIVLDEEDCTGSTVAAASVSSTNSAPLQRRAEQRRVSDSFGNSRIQKKRQRVTSAPNINDVPDLLTASLSRPASAPTLQVPGESGILAAHADDVSEPLSYDKRETPPTPEKTRGTRCSSEIMHSLPSKQTSSDRDIHEALCAKFTQKLNKSDQRGRVYIVKDPQRPELGLKIGSTSKVQSIERFKQIQNQCGFRPELVYITNTVDYCTRLENLIQAELRNRCRPWHCPGHPKKSSSTSNSNDLEGSKHGEWFKMEEKDAQHTVEQWETFMRKHRPYAWYRYLRPVWWHIVTTQELSSTATISPHTHWTRIRSTKPTFRHHIFAYIHLVQHHIIRPITNVLCDAHARTKAETVFWQLVGTVYAALMAFCHPNRTSAGAFLMILVCTCLRIGGAGWGWTWLEWSSSAQRLKQKRRA